MPKGIVFNLSKKNKAAIEEYMVDVRANYRSSEDTVKSHKAFNRMLLGNIGKDYDKIGVKDLNVFYSNMAAGTAEVCKPKNRRFFRFFGMNELADSIKLHGSILSKPVRGDESRLTPEEIDKIIEAPLTLEEKAMIETFIVSGGGLLAIQMLDIGDIDVDKAVVRINMRTAKGGRIRKISVVPDASNPVARWPRYLVQWLALHPNKDNMKAPLFPSNSRSRKYWDKRMSRKGIYAVVVRAGKDAGIDVKFTPQMLRHTAASWDGLQLSEQLMRVKYGWKAGSIMISRYCHHDEKLLEEHLLKKAGISDEEVEHGIICPKCYESNYIKAEICVRCQFILSREKLMKELEEKEKRELERDQEVKDLKAEIDEHKPTYNKMVDFMNWFKQSEFRFIYTGDEEGKKVNKMKENIDRLNKERKQKGLPEIELVIAKDTSKIKMPIKKEKVVN